MRVKIEGKTYEVNFEHVKGNYHQRPVSTRCEIKQIQGKKLETTVSTAYSYAAKTDQFSRTTGRRVALQKALASVWPHTIVKHTSESGRQVKVAPAKNRDIRAKFWKVYFASVEAPKPEKK